ncbi:acetamidase/formamidase family protein [Jidongwangia harbinensis]|uniref:acetamidase/formamidase family protein n=1 Tax=Jidongwangia harbinensis TaxID=2878561 RepID=UPI001CD9A3F4|nr:acetamidase/formamidase family protein [Jidongwangia harbinensis]MCA2216290.1 acetamidase/formamidase family protein [Jidongwangia harbinensis]MCA2217025.1 acetamidase/formamidase family protein [Jidongwangia harbinensis]
MGQHHTFTPTAKDYGYTFGGAMPVATLRSGDTLSTYTEDCFGGAVTTVDDLPSQVCTMPYLNPVTGPFFIDDAEPGDTLAVHLLSLVPARTIGVSSTFPHFGALTSTTHTATLQPPLEERVWLYDIDAEAGVVRYRARNGDYTADLALEPMHGTVGVAPAGFEARSSITCDAHGGNMDTPQLRAGTTLYLGVNVHGAMLSLGDGHARQGHGEASGVAVEVAMHTTLAVEVIKGVPTRWPRIESDTAIMSVGCARPLEDAFRISQHDLVGWTAELTGLDTLDAYQLVAQAGTAPVGNVCDPNYTMLACLPKPLLRGATVYDGAHQRLRATPQAAAPGIGAR